MKLYEYKYVNSMGGVNYIYLTDPKLTDRIHPKAKFIREVEISELVHRNYVVALVKHSGYETEYIRHEPRYIDVVDLYATKEDARRAAKKNPELSTWPWKWAHKMGPGLDEGDYVDTVPCHVIWEDAPLFLAPA